MSQAPSATSRSKTITSSYGLPLSPAKNPIKRQKTETPSPEKTLQNSGKLSRLSAALLVAMSEFLTEFDLAQFLSSCRRSFDLTPRIARTLSLAPNLNFEDRDTVSEFIKRFAHFTKLSVLQFPHGNFTQAATENIATALKDNQLTSFRRVIYSRDCLNSAFLPSLLPACPKLEHIEMTDRTFIGAQFGDIQAQDGDPFLSQLTSFENLRFFDGQYFSFHNEPSSNGNLRVVNLTRFSMDHMEKQLQKWKHLEAMTFPTHVNDSYLSTIAKNASNLRNISCYFPASTVTGRGVVALIEQCPQLERMDASLSFPFSKELFETIKERCKNFHALSATGSALGQDHFPLIPIIGPQLTYLRISSDYVGYSDEDLNNVLPSLGNLRHLSFETNPCTSSITRLSLLNLAKCCPKLRSLELRGIYASSAAASGFWPNSSPEELATDDIIAIANKLPMLELLSLHFFTLGSKEKLSSLGKCCPRLRFLNLEIPGTFSFEAIQAIVTSMPNLRYLRVPKELYKAIVSQGPLEKVFPQLFELLNAQNTPSFSQERLLEWGLPIKEIWPPSTAPAPKEDFENLKK